MLSLTIKVLRYLKGGPLSNPAHTKSSNGMKISTIDKDSVSVSIIDIAPANELIHKKAAWFEYLVQMVSMLKVLHTSSEFIHFMSHHIPV